MLDCLDPSIRAFAAFLILRLQQSYFYYTLSFLVAIFSCAGCRAASFWRLINHMVMVRGVFVLFQCAIVVDGIAWLR